MVFTGLNSTTRENSNPEPFVSVLVMLTYLPFRVSGSLVNVMSTVKPVFTALSTVAVQLRTSTVPWYTGPLVLSETDTAGAGTEGYREMTMTCKHVVHIHTSTCMPEQSTGENVLVTLTTMLSLLLTSTSTLLAATLPVQVYCPLSEVLSGENCRLPVVIVVIVPSVAMLSTEIRSEPLSGAPSLLHEVEIATEVSTSGSSSTSQVRVNTVPAYSVEERSTGDTSWPEKVILGGGTVCVCVCVCVCVNMHRGSSVLFCSIDGQLTCNINSLHC